MFCRGNGEDDTHSYRPTITGKIINKTLLSLPIQVLEDEAGKWTMGKSK